MLATIGYRLRAERGARVPAFHGRLLHGTVFSLLADYDARLSAWIHDRMNLKPFALSLLEPVQEKPDSKQRRGKNWFFIEQGREYLWRLSALREEVLQALLAVRPGTVLAVGEAELCVEEVIDDGRFRTGYARPEEILGGAFSVGSVQEIAFSFRSPTTFRNFDRDYAFPLPELVFGSLADKWTGAEMPGDIERDRIARLASALAPVCWSGRSQKVFLGRKRGLLAFTGKFAYDTSILSHEEQSILLALAQFAEFSGIGRLTAQGLGQTEMEFS